MYIIDPVSKTVVGQLNVSHHHLGGKSTNGESDYARINVAMGTAKRSLIDSGMIVYWRFTHPDYQTSCHQSMPEDKLSLEELSKIVGHPIEHTWFSEDALKKIYSNLYHEIDSCSYQNKIHTLGDWKKSDMWHTSFDYYLHTLGNSASIADIGMFLLKYYKTKSDSCLDMIRTGVETILRRSYGPRTLGGPKDNLDDYMDQIDFWHDQYKGTQELHEFLGLSWHDYKEIVEVHTTARMKEFEQSKYGN